MDRLIVYRKTYEYLFWLRPTVERFGRVHKYSLGVDMQRSVLALLRAIVQANYTPANKDSFIETAVVEFEVQRVYLRLAFDYKLINSRQLTHASGHLDEIARLLRGWRKASK